MKTGIWEEKTGDEEIFNMLLLGEIKSLCPYCKEKNIFSPISEEVECKKCNQEFISPIHNPNLFE